MYLLQNKERPLHIAARHGHVKMVEALLQDEANPQLTSAVSILHFDVDVAIQQYFRAVTVLQ